MRGSHCCICTHPNVKAIDEALMAGGKLVPKAQLHKVSKSSLARHRVGCLSPRLAAATRLTQGANATKALVQNAKRIVAGEPASLDDALSLHGLLSRLVNSLERLEQGAISASSDGLHSSHAQLASQITRAVEAAGKLQGLYSDQPQAAEQSRFSISINTPEVGAALPRNLTIDCAPEPEPSKPAPRLPRRGSFNVGFDLSHQPVEDAESA